MEWYDQLFQTGNALLGQWGSAAINEKYVYPQETRRLALETLGADGLMYGEGRRGVLPAYRSAGGSSGLLLIAVAVVAVVLLKD